MNSNGKTIKMFLKQRDEKRKKAAEAAHVKPEEATFKSLPASKRLRKVQ